MKLTIPIFPLNLVVFPGSRYPLHIFEMRYKSLIEKCIRENTGFGIVASFDRKISDVGVYVLIDTIVKKYENGEYDIIVAGIERFLINETYQHPDGYYLAGVEKFDDDSNEIDNDLINELQSEFEEIVELAKYSLEKTFWDNLKTAKLKSYKIAEKSGLSYEQQQEFLIMKSENARLSYLIDYFASIKEKASTAETVRRIVMNDGYIN